MADNLANLVGIPFGAPRVGLSNEEKFNEKIFDTFSKTVSVTVPRLDSISGGLPVYGSSSMPSTSVSKLSYLVPESEDFVSLSTSYILLQGALYQDATTEATAYTGACGLSDANELFQSTILKFGSSSGVVEENPSDFHYVNFARKITEYSAKHLPYLESFHVYRDQTQQITGSALSLATDLNVSDTAILPSGNPALFRRWRQYSSTLVPSAPFTTAKDVSIALPLSYIFSYLRATPVVMLQPQMSMDLYLNTNYAFPIMSTYTAGTLRFMLKKADLYINVIEPPQSLAATLRENFRLSRPIETEYEQADVFVGGATTSTTITVNTTISRPRPTKVVLLLIPNYNSNTNAFKYSMPSSENITSVNVTVNNRSIYSGGVAQCQTRIGSNNLDGNVFQLYQQYLRACKLQYVNDDAPYIDYETYQSSIMPLAFDISTVGSDLSQTSTSIINMQVIRTGTTNLTPILITFTKKSVILQGRSRVDVPPF